MPIDALVSAVRQAAGCCGNTTRGNRLVEAADAIERLTRLNEDKFRHLQGYCKAADEDRAEIARLTARVRELEAQLRECQGLVADLDSVGR